jgi:hypothetical protein
MRNGENNRDSTDLSIILMLVQWDGNRMGGYSSWASLLGEGYAHGYNCIAVGFFLTPNYDYVATCNWNPQVESKVDGNYNDSKWGSGITWGPIVYECAYTYIHTFIHSYIHTYIHIYIYTYVCKVYQLSISKVRMIKCSLGFRCTNPWLG